MTLVGGAGICQCDLLPTGEGFRGFDKNTVDLRQALKKVEAQWQFSNTGFEQLEDGNYVPHVISVTTTGMLKRMDAITHLYEDLDVTLSAEAVAANLER